MSGPRTALVTGAGSGIGRETALALASRGFSLTLAGRTLAPLRETQRLCLARTPSASIIAAQCDISEWAQAQELVDRALKEQGRVETIVNCAGVAPMAEIGTTDQALWERVFRCNANGAAAIIARAWPHMVQQRSGCIVNISSLATLDPFPGFFAYAASKSAMDSMTRSCHREGSAHGIRVFSLNPGAVETPMLRALFSAEELPTERVLAPSEVAAVAVECIEGKREHQRGQAIAIGRT